jgi:hypothetical protein
MSARATMAIAILTRFTGALWRGVDGKQGELVGAKRWGVGAGGDVGIAQGEPA